MKFLIIFFLIFSCVGWAQVWTYHSDFLLLSETPSPHGIVVTPDEKIWVTNFWPSDSLVIKDSVIYTCPIRIYNPDATLHHKITFLSYEGDQDTLTLTGRGLSLDNNGNVLFSNGYLMRRINYQTFEEMNRQNPFNGNSITQMSCDDSGYVYVHRVIGSGDPIKIFDQDFNLYSELDSSWAISRALLVSRDGNEIYLGRIYGGGGGDGITIYNSDNGNGPHGTYTATDTILTWIWAGQSLNFDNNGLLWAGSYWDCGVHDWGGWYAIDPTQNYMILDTIVHYIGNRGPLPSPSYPAGAYVWAPRSAAWSHDGKKMYTCDYDGGVVKKWTNPDPTVPGDPPLFWSFGIEKDSNKISYFYLKNNYPNPFNLKTKLIFEIKKASYVKLEILDILGRHVKTLVSEQLHPKKYEIEFDGSSLSSGTYYYQLYVDGLVQTRKMLLIK